MHIHGGDRLQRYFEDERAFKPYHLPPDGQLERNAYPFMMFEAKTGDLRFGGFGSEWFGAVQRLDNMQFQ
jgi:hypothetical protein